MSKEAPWHSKTMSLPGASLVGGDERVYHDDDTCPAGQRIPAVRRNKGEGEGIEALPHVRGARDAARARPARSMTLLGIALLIAGAFGGLIPLPP